MLVKIEAQILIFSGTDFHFPSTSVPPGTFFKALDVTELSVDGWQPSEDAVATQSQRLVSSVLSDTAEQCRPGIGASSCRVCT